MCPFLYSATPIPAGAQRLYLFSHFQNLHRYTMGGGLLSRHSSYLSVFVNSVILGEQKIHCLGNGGVQFCPPGEQLSRQPSCGKKWLTLRPGKVVVLLTVAAQDIAVNADLQDLQNTHFSFPITQWIFLLFIPFLVDGSWRGHHRNEV